MSECIERKIDSEGQVKPPYGAVSWRGSTDVMFAHCIPRRLAEILKSRFVDSSHDDILDDPLHAG